MTPRPVVMIVDDDPDDLYALEATLEPLGLEILRAGDGDDALRRLLERDVAVIVMDLLMPRLNGFETAELIRRRERYAEVPIIILTGYDSDGLRAVPGYRPGSYEYLGKPVSPEALRDLVRRCAARAPAGGS